MGLLDEAIREHLELKRLRGADPGRLAHEEREALGDPYERDLTGSDDDNRGPGADTAISPEAPADHEGVWLDAEGDWSDASPDGTAKFDERTDSAGASPHVGQETVELDMTAILYGEPRPDDDYDPVGLAPVGPIRARLSKGVSPPEEPTAGNADARDAVWGR